MKRTEPKSIETIIDEAINEAGLTQTMAARKACYMWPEVVGPGVNRYTLRRYVEGSVLHVYLSSAALKNELSFHRQRIIEELNRLSGPEALTNLIIH